MEVRRIIQLPTSYFGFHTIKPYLSNNFNSIQPFTLFLLFLRLIIMHLLRCIFILLSVT